MRSLRSGLCATLAVVAAAAAYAVPAEAPAEAAGTSASCPWVGSKAPVDTRVAQVLAQMTEDEKITMVHGAAGSAYTGYIPADARLCIPQLKLQDGPVGVRMDDTTQMPDASNLAATFDPSAAEQYGSVIGQEDKAKGVDVDLGPTINIVRDPRWGRAFESYSEDPYLTGAIASGDINGIQSQGVMAQVKHFAVYNQETNRNTSADNAVVDDRTVHEIYTAAFGTVVADSQPSSVMCSYSYINGVAACENSYLDEILKDDFGFTGFITSDWGGTHSTVASANAGLDMDMPGDDGYFDTQLATAIANGQVQMSRLDDMVTRILREEFRFGLFDNPSPSTPGADASTPAHVAAAQQISEDGTVLLKNSGNILPLSSSVKSIAVIGDGAGTNTMSAGGGSATVAGTGTVTPYDGIKARAGSGVDVEYAQGDLPTNGTLPAIASQYFTPPSGTGNGLEAQYYDNMTLSGTPVATQVDPNVDYSWSGPPVSGLGSTDYSVKFTGTLTPPTTGSYTFGLSSDDGSRLLINGQEVIDNWRDQATNTETAKVSLTAGQPVQIEVDYYQDGGDANVNLGWELPGDLQAQATALAAKSDVAIVYADDFESEGSDLSDINLPGDQNQLISAVAAANPNTIVVLNTGSAVTMPWLDQVKGVFEAWYPGQQAGNSIAALLYGDVNPSGKLPVTFPTSLAQVPASTAQQWPGVDGTVDYSEGLDVGYRWYTAKDLQPLYPFGYGLSYTNFKFSALHLDSTALTDNGKIQVTANVTNTGKRSGDEVAQLYLTDAPAAGEPPVQLKGFQKVSLTPGQTTKVTFTLDAQDASYWNTDAQAWALTPGTYTVHVGDSSENLPLSGKFKVTQTDGPRYTTITAPSTGAPGSAITVKTTFTNGSTEPVYAASTKLTLPSGWTATATSPAQFPIVRAGGTASTTWKVSIPASASSGSAQISATTGYAGSTGLPPGTNSASVYIPYPSLASAFDTVGVSDDANPTSGNLDGSGYSFSAEALASVGVTPGGSVGGFTWPDIAAGKPDAVTTNGQVITIQGGSGTSLSFLAAGTNGTQSGAVTVTYTDGTTSSGTITAADWYSNAAVTGCTLVVTSPYWNIPTGSTEPAIHPVSLYSTSIPITAGKTISSVTLPRDSQLHIFATSVQ